MKFSKDIKINCEFPVVSKEQVNALNRIDKRSNVCIGSDATISWNMLIEEDIKIVDIQNLLLALPHNDAIHLHRELISAMYNNINHLKEVVNNIDLMQVNNDN